MFELKATRRAACALNSFREVTTPEGLCFWRQTLRRRRLCDRFLCVVIIPPFLNDVGLTLSPTWAVKCYPNDRLLMDYLCISVYPIPLL